MTRFAKLGTEVTRCETFIGITRQQAEDHGDKVLYTFLPEAAGEPPERVTYHEIDRAARAIASGLVDRGAGGANVLLLYPSGRQFVEAFLGCLYAGATAVPAPLPTARRHHVEPFLGIVRSADVAAVLTLAGALPMVAGLLSQAGVAAPCLSTDTDPVGDPDAWRMPVIGPDALAFLQYTSGSTSAPKGVMVSHLNLIENERLIAKRFAAHPGTVSGGWLPFYHDMGLIGQILTPIVTGGSAVVMSPVAFLKRPYRWLKLISDYGVQVSGGPNFGYEMCAQRVTDEQVAQLDLSQWRLAYNGAEPVRAETMRSFAARFAPAGFRPRAWFPCYGLAEATLMVTGGTSRLEPVVLPVSAAQLEQRTIAAPENADDERLLVSSGAPSAHEVLVVDPERRLPLPVGSVGEIWVRGSSVARGYWREAAATARTFGATTATGSGGFLRTGDLGAVIDGELVVTGRLKEVMIIAGRNIYPQDIELEAQGAHPALADRISAAFSVEADGERVVIVQEVRPELFKEASPASVAAALRRHLTQRLELRVGSVVLVAPGAIPRTTSGKIQRTLSRQIFLDGDLPALHEESEAAVADRRRITAAAS